MARIALLADALRVGGAENMFVATAQVAAAAGHDVVALAPQDWLVERARSEAGVRAVRLAGEGIMSKPTQAGRAAALLAALPRIFAALRATGADLLHVSNGGYAGSLVCDLALPLARAAGIRRRVLTVHAAPRARGEVVAALEPALDRVVWRSADAVVGATRFVGLRLTELRDMPPALYHEVPYGVELPAGAEGGPRLRAEHAPGASLVVAMMSATSDDQKGHAVLIEAVAKAPGVHALIAGSPPPPTALSRVEELGVGDRVTVLGRVDQVGALLAAADVLVVPSVADESLPLVILEAMAAGKPAFASRLSGIPEAVEADSTGMLFEPGDAAALAQMLSAAADGQIELDALGRRAHERWGARYSPQAMADATVALYERLLQAGG